MAVFYKAQTFWDDERLDLLTLSLGMTLPDGIYLNSYISQNLSQNLDAGYGWRAGITFNLSHYLGLVRMASLARILNHRYLFDSLRWGISNDRARTTRDVRSTKNRLYLYAEAD